MKISSIEEIVDAEKKENREDFFGKD